VNTTNKVLEEAMRENRSNVIFIDAAAKPDEPRDADRGLELDFSLTHIQVLTAGGLIGLGLIAMRFVTWLRP
jgi:hypothetical protein